MNLVVSIRILAILLCASGLLALLLLRTVRIQQHRLQHAHRRLRQLGADMRGQRHEMQRAHATEQDLREITWHLPVVAFIVHRGRHERPQLGFLSGNLRSLLGLDASDLLESGQVLHEWPFQDRVHPEDCQQLRRDLRQAMRHRHARFSDFRAYGPDGLHWLRLSVVAHRQERGQTRWVGYLIDTTPINAHNQTLRAARDAAERASRAKADFLATMSHEIRTPMNGVIGMLELLGRTRLDADQHELLHAVEDSASVLLQILDDVLDFSKLEAGNLRLDPAPFDPRVLVDNVVGLNAGTLHRKGLDIIVWMDPTLAGQLIGDDVRLRQILLNLLSNAGKFTEHGSIAVSVRVTGDDGQCQRIRLSVTDTGIGIPADKQAGLFAPFTQAEPWTSRRHGGTGLGLAICRHLVQLMDGSIELRSEPGCGTTVSVQLRLAIARREAGSPAGLRGRHAVVRLAAAELADALAQHLCALGISVETMPPPQPLRPGIAADFLFVDMHDQHSAHKIAARVIAVDDASAVPPPAATERIVLGAHPLKWQSVLRACTQALAPDGTTDAVPAAEGVRRAGAGGRVLVAEDHPVNQSLVRRQLALLGWACDVVENGEAALQALCGNQYILLLTDCQMPLMDGCELAAAWRTREASGLPGRRLPIIAMTAHMLGHDVARFRQAGMDDWLGKPVQLHALEEKLLAWTGCPAPPEASAVNAPSAATLTDPMRHLLLETSREDIRAIEQAIASGDAGAAARRLHRLLGGLQMVTDADALAAGMRRIDALQGEHGAEALRGLPADLVELHKLLDRLEPHTTDASG